MHIVVNLARSTVNFIVINAVLVAANPQNATWYIGGLLAVFMGFLLRIIIDWKDNTISWKNSLIQAGMSLILCSMCVVVYSDLQPKLRIEYFLFFCSLFSVFIIGLLEKVFKLGLSGYARLLLKRVLAEDPKHTKEDIKP